jgi:hypothetical protein
VQNAGVANAKRLPAQRGYANEIAIKLPNRYILDLPEDLDISEIGKKVMFSQYTLVTCRIWTIVDE